MSVLWQFVQVSHVWLFSRNSEVITVRWRTPGEEERSELMSPRRRCPSDESSRTPRVVLVTQSSAIQHQLSRDIEQWRPCLKGTRMHVCLCMSVRVCVYLYVCTRAIINVCRELALMRSKCGQGKGRTLFMMLSHSQCKPPSQHARMTKAP